MLSRASFMLSKAMNNPVTSNSPLAEYLFYWSIHVVFWSVGIHNQTVQILAPITCPMSKVLVEEEGCKAFPEGLDRRIGARIKTPIRMLSPYMCLVPHRRERHGREWSGLYNEFNGSNDGVAGAHERRLVLYGRRQDGGEPALPHRKDWLTSMVRSMPLSELVIRFQGWIGTCQRHVKLGELYML